MEFKNFAELLGNFVCLVDLNKGKYNFKKLSEWIYWNRYKMTWVQTDLGMQWPLTAVTDPGRGPGIQTPHYIIRSNIFGG